jgi:hypothetical protein
MSRRSCERRMRVRDLDFLLLGTAMALFRNLVRPRTLVVHGKGGLLTQPGRCGKRQTAGFSDLAPLTKMAGPKAGQGMQEGRRYFALARNLIGSAPTALVNRGLSLNHGGGGCCLAFISSVCGGPGRRPRRSVGAQFGFRLLARAASLHPRRRLGAASYITPGAPIRFVFQALKACRSVRLDHVS